MNVAKRIVVWGFIATAVALFIACPLPSSPTQDGGGTTYTITYNGNGSTGGTVPADSTAYTSGQTVTVLANTGTLVKSLNTFNGWNTAANGSGISYGASGAVTFIIGAADVTLYAQWTTLPTYTVTYNGNGSTGGTIPTDSTAYTNGQTVTVLANTGTLVKSLNAFNGWNTAANGSGTSYAASGAVTFIIGAADVTLYAQWTTLPTYTVTYAGNGSTGGTVPTDGTAYINGQTVTVLGNTGNLTKAGNGFYCWNTLANGTGTNYSPTATFPMGSANVTLFAIWHTAYTVTYNGNTSTGGTVPSDTNGYLTGATVTVLANTGTLVKSGYAFAGWNTASNGTGTSYAASGTATFVMGSANVTLWAQWSVITYTVTFDSQLGSAVAAQTNIASGDHATEPTAPTRAGYALEGWFTDTGYATRWDFSADTVTADRTLYAKWLTYTAGLSFSPSFDGYDVTKGSANTNGTVTIPEYWAGKVVNSINNHGFENSTGMTAIVIPSGVTSIGSGAFSACTGLTGITIPAGVIYIESYTFYGCTGLTSIAIPAGVAYIDANAFQDCTGLTSVTLPAALTNLGNDAFNGCNNIGFTSLSIPAGVTQIDNNAFYGCSHLASLTIPSGVTVINDSTFNGCSGLTSLTFQGNVTSIGQSALNGCTGLTSLTIPSSVSSIGYSAFGNCTGLVSLEFSSSLASIGSYAFDGCSNLVEVTIHRNTPPSVTQVPNYMFNNCGSLVSIWIPNVASLGEYQFAPGFSYYAGLIKQLP